MAPPPPVAAAPPTNLRAPLWSHVTIIEKSAGGGNTRWKCNYCGHVSLSSYSRVQAHLLKKTGNQGIHACKKVTIDILNALRNEVALAQAALTQNMPKTVPLPSGSASFASSSASTKKRRGDGSSTAIEKAWVNDLRKQLNEKIARAFYSGGLAFNFARNPHYQESFNFAATHNIPGYKPPGYNRLRTTLLKNEKMHIDKLLEHVKSTWIERGVTICADGWSDPCDYILKITEPVHDMIRVTDTDNPCLHLVYEMWDSMIEKVRKAIYDREERNLNDHEESPLFKQVYKVLLSRWTKGNNPLHCLAHSLNPRYYSAKWLAAGEGRVPPHRDIEVSAMRNKCMKKFFPIEEDLARAREEFSRFSTCSEEFNDHDSINDRWVGSAMSWWTNHGVSIPLLQSLAIKLVSQPASSSCCERNWSTYGFIHNVSRSQLTPQRAEDLVYCHSNLRLLSRRSEAYKKGESLMWDVGGDSHETLTGVGVLEVANLSLDEPELQGISFGDVDATVVNLDDEATNLDDEDDVVA